MDWKTYSEKFRNKAIINGKNEDYINKQLEYAKHLFENDLPIIYDQYHFSLLVGVSDLYITAVSNSSKKYYRYFSIPKKNGSKRKIAEPLPTLKEIQIWILDNILYKVKVNPFIKSYCKGRSIIDNAKFHKNQKNVLTIDIKDYFLSLNQNIVYDFFIKLGYKVEVATMLSNLCCLKYSLPQGAPTSPMLSNLITSRIDNEIGNITIPYGIRYSRYADDLTFSGDFEVSEIIKQVRKILKAKNLKINNSKIRNRKRHQQQEVTGIVVNDKIQVSRKKRDKVKQEIYYIEKYGLEEHLKKTKKEKVNYIDKLIGLNEFILSVNKNDTKAIKNREKLKKLKNTYRE